ncbi:MAG: hypothetical protein KJ622_10780 [Alphaproteobacteria bacterium]|nr:hypothetical protein [Alphaproteobacteria bacterium]
MQTSETRHSNDDSLLALDLIEAAWCRGKESGVPHELMAYAAVFAGMRDLVAIFGETAAAAMAKNLENRIKQGEFSGDVLPDGNVH